MILTFAEDFSGSVQLDSELTGMPESGLYLNRGVLPIVTVENLLSLLPVYSPTFSAWNGATTYSKYETSKSKTDIVTYNSKTYQSLQSANLNKNPGTETSYWLETNIDSLKIKAFLWTVQNNLLAKLSLHRKLVENQFIYNVGEQIVSLPNDFSGWAFEPKGSDYIKIRINQMSLQANTTDPVNVYVINQGRLVETLVLNPNDGLLSFENVGYTISGKGRFLFVFDSQEVYSDNAYNDPLKFDGFVAYPVTGVGSAAATATYTDMFNGNGLNFNVSAYLDSSDYVTNNLIDFARAYQAQFEMDFVQMLRFNANTRTNDTQRIIGVDKNYLDFQMSEFNANTIAKKYADEIKTAMQSINKTFDRFLKSPKKIVIKRGSI
jgi:hypothetical protein